MVTCVITTCKRDPGIVTRARASVAAQSCRDLQILVVDDSPRDYPLREAVRQAVSTFEGAIYVAHETCRGACAARNTGLRLAEGEFIAYLDDDDEWLPDKIETQLSAFESDAIGLVYCDFVVCNDTTGEERVVRKGGPTGSVYEELILNNFIGSASFPMLRTAALRDVGGFDVDMRAAQDTDAWLRVSQRCQAAYVPRPLVRYHIHEGEQIGKNPMNKIAGFERLAEKNADYLRTHPKARWLRMLKITPFYAQAGEGKKALGTWLRAAVLRPLEIRTNLAYLRGIFRRRRRAE